MGDGIIVRLLPQLEGNALGLEELGDRLAVLRPDDVVDFGRAAARLRHRVRGLEVEAGVRARARAGLRVNNVGHRGIRGACAGTIMWARG